MASHVLAMTIQGVVDSSSDFRYSLDKATRARNSSRLGSAKITPRLMPLAIDSGYRYSWNKSTREYDPSWVTARFMPLGFQNDPRYTFNKPSKEYDSPLPVSSPIASLFAPLTKGNNKSTEELKNSRLCNQNALRRILVSVLSCWEEYFHANSLGDYRRDKFVFCTATGFVGVAPETVVQDDIVTLGDETYMPAILRPCGDHYEFLCYCYLPTIHRAENEAFTEIDFDVR